MYLYFGQHRDNRGHDAEQHVEAYEELVDEASVGLSVEDEEQHNSSQWQDVVKDRYRQQSYKQIYIIIIIIILIQKCSNTFTNMYCTQEIL